MSKKKQLATPQEEEFFDFNDMESYDEDEMINTFGQVADASMKHIEAACHLTEIIVATHKDEKLSTDDILDIFRKAAAAVLDTTPLKALFEGKA